jgi:hypothetical protein
MELTVQFTDFLEEIYEYPGHWDCPSRCGILKRQLKDGRFLVIATEIYRNNPGTPVTEWCAQIATRILLENNINPDYLIFIEHTPDLKSKLSFYDETFDLVEFNWENDHFTNPQWKRISTEEVKEILMLSINKV